MISCLRGRIKELFPFKAKSFQDFMHMAIEFGHPSFQINMIKIKRTPFFEKEKEPCYYYANKIIAFGLDNLRNVVFYESYGIRECREMGDETDNDLRLFLAADEKAEIIRETIEKHYDEVFIRLKSTFTNYILEKSREELMKMAREIELEPFRPIDIGARRNYF